MIDADEEVTAETGPRLREVIEGDSGHTRTVMLKFKDRDEAKRWYNSDEYQAILGLRMDSISGAKAVLCDEFQG